MKPTRLLPGMMIMQYKPSGFGTWCIAKGTLFTVVAVTIHRLGLVNRRTWIKSVMIGWERTMKSNILKFLYVIAGSIPIGYVIAILPTEALRLIVSITAGVLFAMAVFRPSDTKKAEGGGDR